MGDASSSHVESELIVGFTTSITGQSFVAAVTLVANVLQRLKALGAPAVECFVVPRAGKKGGVVALAVVRPKPGVTFNALQIKTKSVPGIAYIERNAPLTLARFDDRESRWQWALGRVGIDGPLAVLPPGGKTIVAIVDTGLRRPDGTLPEDIGQVEALDFCQPPGIEIGPLKVPPLFPDGIDKDGHGTLLAGTIAGVPDNMIGVASPIAANWGISLMPIKFFDPATPANIFHAAWAMYWAIYQGAKVIDASWHVSLGNEFQITLEGVLEYAADHGCVVVAAAGNDGSDNREYPTYPANYAGGLTVAASAPDDWKAPFSNYGRTLVGIAAPGVRIVSTGAYWAGSARYPTYSGTSASAALVSAGAALVYALNPGWQAAEVIQHLKDSADKLASLALVCEDGNRLNIRRAVLGPLHVAAPRPGARLRAGTTSTIRWTNDYPSAKLGRVKIEFSIDGGVLYRTLVASTANSGSFAWKILAADRTGAGVIRITPVAGNFPVLSGRFRVV